MGLLFRNIPLFNKMTDTQLLERYANFLKQLIDNIKNGLKPDILLLLMATKIKYENFASAAIKSIWYPVNSIDAKRSFSRYT